MTGERTPKPGAETGAATGKGAARASVAPRRARRGSANARSELVREELLEKAADLFSHKGLAATSINDIADALSLKRSSIYYYFQNKEEIIREIFLDEYEGRARELSALLERDDLSHEERLVAAIEGAITQRMRAGSRFIVFDRLEAEAPDELREMYNRCRRQILGYYRQIIEDGTRDGAFRVVDPQLAAFAVIGMANWTALWASPSGEKSARELARDLCDLVVHGLAPHGAPDPRLHPMDTALRNIRAELDKLPEPGTP